MIEKLQSLIFGRENNIARRTTIWTFIFLVINAMESVVVLMAATRTMPLEEVGMVTIGFTVSNLFLLVGKFGASNYQTTDVRNEFTLRDYLQYKIATSAIMLVAFGIYLLYGIFFVGYSVRKCLVITLVFFLFFTESLEEVFRKEYQRKQRLDVGNMMFSLRWAICLMIIVVLLFLTHNIMISLLVADFAGLLILFVFVWLTRKRITHKEDYVITAKWYKLMGACYPIFISGFCLNYINNVSKYAIDACLDDTTQAYYGFVAMPNFVIGMLASVFYQPMLVTLSQQWILQEYTTVKKQIKKQICIILLIAVVCLAGGWLLGIPALSWLYKVELTGYKTELMILLFSGMFVSMNNFLTCILVMMRKQKDAMLIYLFVAVLVIIFTNAVVRRYLTVGAACINAFWQMLITSMLSICIYKELFVQRR